MRVRRRLELPRVMHNTYTVNNYHIKLLENIELGIGEKKTIGRLREEND